MKKNDKEEKQYNASLFRFLEKGKETGNPVIIRLKPREKIAVN